jgi:hypothetical protein
MKTSLHITASFDKPELVEYIAQTLAAKPYPSPITKTQLPGEWRAIETSSVENYVSGNVDIMEDDEAGLHVPFKTCFLFTCIRGKNDPYRLDWGMSFS